MNVGLIDIDGGKFPNLVLMKLSAWHKKQGDTVNLISANDVLCGMNLFEDFGMIYGACVFSWNKHIADDLEKIGVRVGGIGTQKKDTLPHDIEHIMPDYSLYGVSEAYGFLSRGCPRHCPFCVVGDKEGLISRKVADLSEFWCGQKKIVLCDPNLLACSERIDLLKQLADSKASIDINQGFDARLLNEEVIELMNQIKIERVHFAWDNPRDSIVPQKLVEFNKLSKIQDYRKKTVYVLANYWSTHQEDRYRVEWLKANGFDPYVMVYDKWNAPKITRKFQKYVNSKMLFHSKDCPSFDEYKRFAINNDGMF